MDISSNRVIEIPFPKIYPRNFALLIEYLLSHVTII